MTEHRRPVRVSIDDVRARVRGWPAELGARFETVAAEWLSDLDAKFVGELLEDLVADLLAPVDVLVDVDDHLAAKIGAVLHHIDTMEDVMPDKEPSELRGLERIKFDEDPDWQGPGVGEIRVHDPARTRHAPRARGPLFDRPDWPLSPGDPT